jgi:HD-GYP domain-containing protein (c-di-GMP phosphodiesterase class II)
LSRPRSSRLAPNEIIRDLRQRRNGNYDSQVINAMKRVVLRKADRTPDDSLLEELELLHDSTFEA